MSVQTLGLYLYGVIANRPGCLDPGLQGIEEQPIRLLPYRDLAVLISESARERFRPQRHLLLAHTRVLEQAIACGFPVLPVRFGTSASCAARVIDRWLRLRYEELIQLLGRMAGHHEMGLRVIADRQELIEEVMEASPEIREQREAIAGRPPETTYFERIQIGSRIGQELARRRQTYQDSILAPLRPLAADFRLNDTLGDSMLLNAAFLVRADREAAFEEEVESLSSRHPEHLQFRYVRHVPPYNFVNLEVNIDDDP